jgi:hypothetical protein
VDRGRILLTGLRAIGGRGIASITPFYLAMLAKCQKSMITAVREQPKVARINKITQALIAS